MDTEEKILIQSYLTVINNKNEERVKKKNYSKKTIKIISKMTLFWKCTKIIN